jgi:hypothetical protein
VLFDILKIKVDLVSNLEVKNRVLLGKWLARLLTEDRMTNIVAEKVYWLQSDFSGYMKIWRILFLGWYYGN